MSILTALLCLLVAVGFPAPLHPQTSTQDESAIQQVLSGMAEVWNQGDAKALASFCLSGCFRTTPYVGAEASCARHGSWLAETTG
jgi:hypothetical protein